MNFNLIKKPGLVWIAKEFSQCNYILSLALFFTIILIWGYIIQHQNMKDSLQQSSPDVFIGSKAFIKLNILAYSIAA